MKKLSPYSSMRRLTDAIEYLVDPRVGVLSKVTEWAREPGAPDFYHYYAEACDTRAFSMVENFKDSGGASSNRERAAAKAVGEAVERYCAAIFNVEELPFTTYEKASFPCIHPGKFALFSAEQFAGLSFPWTPFSEDTLVRWYPMCNLLTGRDVHVPAAMVFVPYRYFAETGESPITQPISTGLACHCSFEEAVIGGACEAIERDAFTITWQAMLNHPQIRVETLSDANFDLVQRFKRAGGKVTLFYAPMDHGIATILSVQVHPSPIAPALVFAAAASLDPEDAVRKSLEELELTRSYCQIIKRSQPPVMSRPPYHLNIVDQATHIAYWCRHEVLPEADFLFTSKERVSFRDIENLATGDHKRDLRTLCSRIEGVGHSVLACDLTTRDIRELGMCVARVVIPGFNPLYMGYNIRARGGKRLKDVPQKLGYVSPGPDGKDNPSPHPFP